MRFGIVPLAEAEGAILAHTLRAGGRVLKKGRRLDAETCALLAGAGIDAVMAARLEPGDLGEDEVARRVAEALAGPAVRVAPAKTGRANLWSEAHGRLEVDRAAIDDLNAVHEAITVATLTPGVAVRAGEMIATVKVIPFAVPEAIVADACARVAGSGALRVMPFRALKVGVVATWLAGQPEARSAQGLDALDARVRALGGEVVITRRVPHAIGELGAALAEVLAAGVELALVLGASAIVDREDVVPAALVACGGRVLHFGMPVDPGNLILIGEHAADGAACVPVIGVPSCARSPKRSGFDLVLERIFAGLPVGAREVMALGVGGLLPEIGSRPSAREDRPEHEAPRVRVAALVMAAGSSRRMGAVNKLLAPIDGVPMVARVVARVREVVAEVLIVTGHEGDAVADAVAGLGVERVHNAAHLDGLASSLAAGVRALDEEVDAVLVCLGDMPWVKPETLRALLATFAAFDPSSGRAICVPTCAGKRGNPVLWPRRFFAEIEGLAGDVGARELLARHADAVAMVAVEDPGILWDVDTEAALERLARGGAHEDT